MSEAELVRAVLRGDPAALTAFDAWLRQLLGPLCAAQGARAAEEDELLQQLRVRLLVARSPGDPRPALLDYDETQGELRPWVRVIAARLLVDLRRDDGAPRRVLVDDLARFVDPGDSPESSAHDGERVALVRKALTDALATLDARDRLLLHLHHGEELSVDKLAAMYGVHRATCARWLTAARENLQSKVTTLLGRALGGSASELKRTVALVAGEIELSWSQIFGAPSPRRTQGE